MNIHIGQAGDIKDGGMRAGVANAVQHRLDNLLRAGFPNRPHQRQQQHARQHRQKWRRKLAYQAIDGSARLLHRLLKGRHNDGAGFVADLARINQCRQAQLSVLNLLP